MRLHSVFMRCFLLLFAFSAPIYAATIGSSSAVSVEPNFTLSSTGNIIESFAMISSGFTLTDDATEVTFKSVFPVTGPLDFNEGLIILQSNMIFGSGAQLQSLANFRGNGNLIDLPTSFTVIYSSSSSAFLFEDVNLRMNSPITVYSDITFKGDCLIDGNGETLTLDSGAQLIIDANSKLTLRNVILKGANGTCINCVDSSGELVLDGVEWVQNGSNFNFSEGKFVIKNSVKMSGDGIFAYSSDQVSTINSDSKLKLDANFTFSYDPAGGSSQLINFQDDTACLVLNGATLHITTAGLELTQGTILVKDESDIFVERIDPEDPEVGSVIGNGLTIGASNGTIDAKVEIYPGGVLHIYQGTVNYKNANLSSWVAHGETSSLYMHEGSRLNLYESLDSSKGSIVFCHRTVLGEADGKHLLGRIMPVGQFVRTFVS